MHVAVLAVSGLVCPSVNKISRRRSRELGAGVEWEGFMGGKG